MPRTKAVKKRTTSRKKSNDAEYVVMKKRLNKQASEIVEMRKAERTAYFEKLRREIDLRFEMMIRPIPSTIVNKTVGELKNEKNQLFMTISENMSSESVVEVRNTVKGKRKTRRSVSYTEDDGYLTAESTGDGNSTGRRTSRARMKGTKEKPTRLSRSLSRSKMQQPVIAKNFRTPLNKKIPETFGTVTPKVKPNTPQVLLRRPKQGEVAISLQGSPLMVNPVVADQIANINIPLQDGRLLSIQPQRGLRMSQLPQLDADTHRQIQALRDNLNKMCAFVQSQQM